MKWIVCFLVVGCLSLNSFAKDKGFEGRINSVQKGSGENKKGEDIETLKINTIQSGEKFPGILRVSMELKGKNGKTAWGKRELKQGAGTIDGGHFKGAKFTGAVTWDIKAGNAGLKRPKLKAYTVEYGYMKEGEFIVIDEDFYKVDSAEELETRNKESQPLTIKASTMSTVD